LLRHGGREPQPVPQVGQIAECSTGPFPQQTGAALGREVRKGGQFTAARLVHRHRQRAGRGRWLAIPAEAEQRQPACQDCGIELQQGPQILRTAELHPSLLEPQQQVHLLAAAARQPPPVGWGGPVHIQAPAKGRRMAHLAGIAQGQGGVLGQPEGQEIAIHGLVVEGLG
jgi:hypothetical protein